MVEEINDNSMGILPFPSMSSYPLVVVAVTMEPPPFAVAAITSDGVSDPLPFVTDPWVNLDCDRCFFKSAKVPG